MASMITHADDLGIKRNNFSMVYEGFWDLYWAKPGTSDLKPKTMKTWLNHVKLTQVDASEELPEFEQQRNVRKQDFPKPQPEMDMEGMDGEIEQEPEEPAYEEVPNIKAIARIRIPFKDPEPVVEGEEPEVDAKSHKSGKSGKSGVPKEIPLEEIDYEDKVLALNTHGEYNLYVVHQLAQRMLREWICKCFKEYLPELQVLDEEEMVRTVETEAEKFELSLFKTQYPKVPLFDYELN